MQANLCVGRLRLQKWGGEMTDIVASNLKPLSNDGLQPRPLASKLINVHARGRVTFEPNEKLSKPLLKNVLAPLQKKYIAGNILYLVWICKYGDQIFLECYCILSSDTLNIYQIHNTQHIKCMHNTREFDKCNNTHTW